MASKNTTVNKHDCLLTDDELGQIRRYLAAQFTEYFAIFELHSVPASCSQQRLSDGCLWTDAGDASDCEYLAEKARELALPGNSVWVIAFTSLEQSEAASVKGKRPNAAGLVPLGGAY